jgi:hypothetical protein
VRSSYVGDRVEQRRAAGARRRLTAIHIARGPWGVVQARWPEAQGPAPHPSLAELPAMLADAA